MMNKVTVLLRLGRAVHEVAVFAVLCLTLPTQRAKNPQRLARAVACASKTDYRVSVAFVFQALREVIEVFPGLLAVERVCHPGVRDNCAMRRRAEWRMTARPWAGTDSVPA